jgi:hypothetical protein
VTLISRSRATNHAPLAEPSKQVGWRSDLHRHGFHPQAGNWKFHARGEGRRFGSALVIMSPGGTVTQSFNHERLPVQFHSGPSRAYFISFLAAENPCVPMRVHYEIFRIAQMILSTANPQAAAAMNARRERQAYAIAGACADRKISQ